MVAWAERAMCDMGMGCIRMRFYGAILPNYANNALKLSNTPRNVFLQAHYLLRFLSLIHRTLIV